MVLVVVVVSPSICLSASLKTKLFCETSSAFELDNIKNAAIQRDFLNFWTWQRQKRSNPANSARLFHFKLTTSKTKQFCETSFKNDTLSAGLTASYQCVLRFFHSTCLNYCACHEKVIPGHTKCCTCHAKSSLSLVLRLPRKMHLCRSSSNVPRLPSFLEMRQNPHVQNGIWTSKSAPNPSVFCTFDFEMCFAPQRRALFRHLNFQKWSEAEVLCTFWLRNVLRATTACTFSTSQLLKVLRMCGVFFAFFTDKCASRHNGARFFDISTSKSGPNMWCLVCILASLLFDSPEPEKHNVSRLSYLFAHLDLLSSETFSFLILFLLLFSSLTLPVSAFHLSKLLEVWLLNFLRLYHMIILHTCTYLYIYILYIFSRRYDYCDSGLRHCWLGLTRLFLHDTFPSASPGRKLLLETRIAWNHVTTLHRTVYNSRLHHLVSSWNWLGLQVPWTMCEFRFASGWDSGIFRCGFRMVERERYI